MTFEWNIQEQDVGGPFSSSVFVDVCGKTMLWFLAKCSSNLCRLGNDASQNVHACFLSVSPLCIRLWAVMLPLCANFRPQISHSWDFVFVCVIICVARWLLFSNLNPHSAHSTFRIFRCTNWMCDSTWLFRINVRPQYSHWNGSKPNRFFTWCLMWTLKLGLFFNCTPQ